MQSNAQALIVARDQFALKGLSDEALKEILPAYRQLVSNLIAQLQPDVFPTLSAHRQFWLRSQAATIEAQFQQLGLTIKDVLNSKQLKAWENGAQNALDYARADAIEAKKLGLTSTTKSGQEVTVTGNQPSLGWETDPAFVSDRNPEGRFIRPSITRQQIAAAQGETGFLQFTTGVKDAEGKWTDKRWTVDELIRDGMKGSSNQLVDQLRAGFLGGETNDEIARRVSHFFGHVGGRNGGKVWAMTQAVVRTSMAEASQSAHDAFYEANEDLLIPTKSGYKWWWDASNDTRLCPECAPMDGVKFKKRTDVTGWPRHFNCRCKILPWTATMELLEEEDGPASGSFLDRVPVEYEPAGHYKNGKPRPPKPKAAPAGYTGDNAYKRPMRIDGKMYWVRRQDMGKGETLAGDMLKNMKSDEAKAAVLGTKPIRHPLTGKEARPVQVWNDMIKQKKYAENPQSLVRKLLGDPLPPGSTAPRPVRGPKPKPPAPKPVLSQAEKVDKAGAGLLAKHAPSVRVYESIKRKHDLLVDGLAERLASTTDYSSPEYKKLERQYLKLRQILSNARVKAAQSMTGLRNAMLQTPLKKAELQKLLDGVTISSDISPLDQSTLKRHLTDYTKMFNGNGLTKGENGARGLSLIGQDARGFSRVGLGEIKVRPTDASNIYHEITHVVENQNKWMGEWAQNWVKTRAYGKGHAGLPNAVTKPVKMVDGKPVYRLSELAGIDYGPKEIGFADDFAHPYMGKHYDDYLGLTSTEVWTMAVQEFHSPQSMFRLYSKHPDLFRMVVGLSRAVRP